MAVIVSQHAPALKANGFRKRRHSFNRPASDGLVHVVNFWMAPKEPPAWTEVPGLREQLYGHFRIDFGVYIPEMARTHTPRSAWINEYDCHLRRSVGDLMPDREGGFWWGLDDPRAAVETGLALEQFGVPWLDGFPNHAAVLEGFEAVGPFPLGMTPAGGLDIADLYRAMGRTAEERRTLEQYVSRPVLRNHAPYLADHLTARGHPDLASRITVAK